MKLINVISLVSFLALLMTACDKTADDDFVDENNESTQIVTSRNLKISFSTTTPNGEYAPFHILAVWIETEDGSFVRSLKVRASERKKYLYTWKEASNGDETDAITGATIGTHTTHDIDWNMQSHEQLDISTGNYTLNLEMTDKNEQGVIASFPFAFNDTVTSQNYDDTANFKDITIVYTQTTDE